MDDKVRRLIDHFEGAGRWGKRGLYAEISKETGFTPAYVGQVFSGKKDPAEKFIMAVCSAYDIPRLIIETGVEPDNWKRVWDKAEEHEQLGYLPPILEEDLVDVTTNDLVHTKQGLLRGWVKDSLKNRMIVEAMKDMHFYMSERQRLKAVSMLKDLHDVDPRNPDGE